MKKQTEEKTGFWYAEENGWIAYVIIGVIVLIVGVLIMQLGHVIEQAL